MNEIVTNTANLPANIEDLSKFVLVGREKLIAVRAEIRAIQKVGLAKEVYDQKQKEAQALAEAVIDAECKIGELMRDVEKASGGDRRSEDFKNPDTGNFEKGKTEKLKDIGFGKNRTSEFQQMSEHPEAVAAAKAEAREADDIVTRSAVLDKIKAENAALKRKVQELESQEPKVVTKTVEVVPDDYQKTKQDLEFAKYTAERTANDLQKLQKKYMDAMEQVGQLSKKLGSNKESDKAERDIQYFTTATNDYIRRYGGHVWAFNEIQNVDETIRTDYLKAIRALDAFAQQMITNIEGGIV